VKLLLDVLPLSTIFRNGFEYRWGGRQAKPVQDMPDLLLVRCSFDGPADTVSAGHE
jgi:hypothetical protein